MSELDIESASTTSRKNVRVLFYVLGFSIACFFLVIYLGSRPRYIEVEIDLPGERDWSYTEKSTRVWTDNLVYFIWRRETRVYKDSPDHLDSTGSVIEYIDDQLTNSGWKYVYSVGHHPCDSFMPESNFLEWETTYIGYKEQDWVKYQRGTPTLCLAVWPIENYDGFHVVMMTENPSYLTEWQYFLD